MPGVGHLAAGYAGGVLVLSMWAGIGSPAPGVADTVDSTQALLAVDVLLAVVIAAWSHRRREVV